MFHLLLLLPHLLCPTFAAVPGDLVTSLPGYPGTLPTKHYSGFVTTPHPSTKYTTTVNIHTHYWLVEAQAPLDPATAPTLVWMQGGPGGSSLIGLFTENGPITLNDYSTLTTAFNTTHVPTVFDNPHSWNKLANVLYVEHPAPTGFSYCSGYNTFQCPPWNDHTQAEASFAFFVKFFSAKYYKELASNPLFFSGESYAGVLVPTLAQLLLQARTPKNKHLAPYNIQGFALGNDCPGNQVYTCTPYSGWLGTQVALDFRFRHGMINESLYNTINQVCANQWNTFEGPTSQECRDLLEDPIRPVLSSAGDTYNMGGGYYLYDTCDGDLLDMDASTHQPRVVKQHEYTVDHLVHVQRTAQRNRQHDQNKRHPLAVQVDKTEQYWMTAATAATAQEYYNDAGTYACGQERASLVWLNVNAVREASHVPVRANSTEGRPFSFSTALPGYNFTAHTLLPLYNDTLIGALTIMQYSGEADPCVPYIGTERWVASLNMPVASTWRPWKSGHEIAGYTTRYQQDDAHFFDFVTIRNAGHMVPRYKPKASLDMMAKFLKDAIALRTGAEVTR